MIDNVRSLQLISCHNCSFNWHQIWASYSQSIWSLQHQDDHEQQQQQQQQQLQTISEIL
jgi:hypothetical protein